MLRDGLDPDLLTHSMLATSLFGDLAARLYEDASAPLREHPGSPRLLNLAPDPRAVGQVDLPAGDEELLETANPITECDRLRSYVAPDPPFCGVVPGVAACLAPRRNDRSV